MANSVTSHPLKAHFSAHLLFFPAAIKVVIPFCHSKFYLQEGQSIPRELIKIVTYGFMYHSASQFSMGLLHLQCL